MHEKGTIMRVADLRELFDYAGWANARILAAAAGITDEQFVAPTRFPQGNLRGCLLHILNALRFHLAGWQDQPAPPDLAARDFPDIASVKAQLAREEAGLQAFLAALTDADLDQLRTLTFAEDGVRIIAPMWKLMAHNINHGTQHRSDAAQMLTDLGHSPGDLDLSEILPTMPIES
jgi:uncharacterized damage-inducible protein DinB